FARAPAIPARLLTVPNAHQAAMLENALPGSSADRPKSPARMLATEGVVSALFYRVLRDRAIQENREPSAFYRSFGTTPDAVDGLDNAYLKVFAAIHAAGYDALAVVRAPETLFPTDALALESILEDVLVSPPAAAPRELWLLHESVTPPATLFDQFRGAPVAHAFDLNAASPADLAGVPGIGPDLAARIQSAAPFGRIEDLIDVPGITPEALSRFQEMRGAMLRPPPPGTAREERLSLRT